MKKLLLCIVLGTLFSSAAFSAEVASTEDCSDTYQKYRSHMEDNKKVLKKEGEGRRSLEISRDTEG